ncbi:MAG TPA: 50S ribosomal protein L35 [Candidatus Campbellbacteria bacterium]|nr:50S ribosomal protein L35 [Candidatus Campbellbacteria bacterium]
MKTIMLKTNKSLSKRLRVTKTGKVLRRKPGQDHFNAKQKRSKQLSQKRIERFEIKKKNLSRFLPYE